MKTYFIICDECFDSLDTMGIAKEVYCLITNNFLENHSAIRIEGSWRFISSFLEKKGFIVTHEVKNGIFALPVIMPCNSFYILGKRCHKCE